jgi:hypothetical protein
VKKKEYSNVAKGQGNYGVDCHKIPGEQCVPARLSVHPSIVQALDLLSRGRDELSNLLRCANQLYCPPLVLLLNLNRGAKKMKNLVVLDRIIGFDPFCKQNVSSTR